MYTFVHVFSQERHKTSLFAREVCLFAQMFGIADRVTEEHRIVSFLNELHALVRHAVVRQFFGSVLNRIRWVFLLKVCQG